MNSDCRTRLVESSLPAVCLCVKHTAVNLIKSSINTSDRQQWSDGEWKVHGAVGWNDWTHMYQQRMETRGSPGWCRLVTRVRWHLSGINQLGFLWQTWALVRFKASRQTKKIMERILTDCLPSSRWSDWHSRLVIRQFIYFFFQFVGKTNQSSCFKDAVIHSNWLY